MPGKLKHGHCRNRSPEYGAWVRMKVRCSAQDPKTFASYGARGITVCDEWRHDFLAFLAYVGPRPSTRHSLDRIDNDRGYEPGNVRWAVPLEQNRNRRDNRLITWRGESLTAGEWAERTGLSRSAIYDRVFFSGWPVAEALTTPRGMRRARAAI